MRWRVKSASSAASAVWLVGSSSSTRLYEDDRVVGATELLVVDARHLRVELLALGRIGGQLDATLGDADEIGPPLRAREERLQRVERLGVGRIEREHVLVALRRFVDVAEPAPRCARAHPVAARELRVGQVLARSSRRAR